MNHRIDPLVRIKRGVVIDKNGCWIWQWRRFPNGSACIKANGRNHVASRIMFELRYGPIPAGKYLHHKCANKACCNPNHLELVSPSEHVERSPKFLGFINRHRTHCIRGHELIPANTYIDQRGGRHCRKCNRIRQLTYLSRKRKERLMKITYCQHLMTNS